MGFNRTELMPGVFLSHLRSDKFKTACMSVTLLTQLRRETAAMNAVIPFVLRRGTTRYSDMEQLSRRMDELYGAAVEPVVRRIGEIQCIGFYGSFPEPDYLPGGEALLGDTCALMAQLLLDPVTRGGLLLPQYVDSEREKLLDIIRSRMNDKRSYATSQLVKLMCEEEAYGVPRLGELADVQGVDAEGLYAHYRKILAEAQVELFYMGRKAPQDVAACLQKTFAALPRAQAFAQVATKQAAAPDMPREVREALDVTQGKLCIGLRTGCTVQDESYPALLMLNAIYGGGVTSKLFQNVREQMSLCYYAGSSIEKFKGVMVVSAGIEFDKYQTAKDEILRQLELCRSGEITYEESDSARRYILSELKLAKDSPGRLDDFYMGQVVAGLRGTMDELAERVSRVTKDEVAAAARRLRLDTIYFLEGETA